MAKNLKTAKGVLFLAATLALGVVALVVGCSGKRIKGLVPARGVVLFNGDPVEGATVIFAPKEIGLQAGSASAVTDKDGRFQMTTLDPGDGVFPGEYRVSVAKDRVEGGPTLEQARLAPAEYRKIEAEIPPQVTIRELPALYGDLTTSGLVATVPAGGVKDLQFELEGEADSTPLEAKSGRGIGPGL